ncbi:trypsin beta-like [Anoplophora glabripennis]|uniref:trypsin beta-like n=1 Tax=Anoplophora glabripennis TaxID=217634 RepID=UPI000873CD46|nr:trypsin beta-like [Anoplophora glabripennis]
MIFPSAFPLCVCVVAALVRTAIAAPSDIKPESPCLKLFHYESVNEPGRWTGNLEVNSEDELHGVWIRVIFDSPVKELIAEGYEVVLSKDRKNEALIKNKNILLKAGSISNIKITGKYDGDKFPNLIEYRLNAKTICPAYNTLRTDLFEGDDNSIQFLSSILSRTKPPSYKPTFECGLKRSDVYPWQAAVSITKDGKDQYICEATLISTSHVILPAHCVTFSSDDESVPENILSVTLAGAKDTLRVKNIIVHRGYDPNILIDDVAILELDAVLKISDNVRPICLEGTDGSIDSLVLVGKAVEADQKIGNQALETIVDDVDTGDCALKNPELAALLGDNSVCVSYPSGKSACTGSSGSSIISRVNNVATLRGIVIVGPLLQDKNQCNADTTTVGINIARYYKWILRSIS